MKRGFILRGIVLSILVIVIGFVIAFITASSNRLVSEIFIAIDILGVIALVVLVFIGLLKFVFGTNPKRETDK